MGASALCEYLDWDSEFFGVRIARVFSRRLDAAAVRRILKWCDAASIACLYFLADAGDPATVQHAEANGFRLVDVRVTLDRRLGDASREEAARRDGVVRTARPADVPELRAIARVSHHDSRFYQDGGFPALRCDALYETWIERSCNGYADTVLVADFDGRPAGYVSCHRREVGLGQIGLFAVGPDFQGRGLGRALVTAALGWFAAQGLRDVLVVTQGRNAKAQRLYQRCGFLTKEVGLWYHRWFTTGASGRGG